mmetsp:Transcript_17356/g.31283  ORF Transcript_17356/g.31283 Transcript_17356/m.31283 type:complete len:854 (+) Transcript_17356:3455-6016(+)
MDQRWAEEDSDSEHQNSSEYDFDSLPDFACFYCGNHQPETLARCTHEGCGRWFCNSYGVNRAGSHIVLHLVKARHRSIMLHPENRLGDETIRCFTCNSGNIFLLGLVPSRVESTLIFLCREPCLSRSTLNKQEWDLESWMPIIEEKRLITFIVGVPTDAEDKRAKKIPISQISNIEEAIRKAPETAPAEIDMTAMKQVQLKYANAKQYRYIFEPLVKKEEEYDKLLKQNQKQTNVNVKWERTSNRRLVAKFVFAKEDNEIRMVAGVELKLKAEHRDWQAVGTVIAITDFEQVMLEVLRNSNPPEGCTYTIEFVWKSTTYKRMLEGLRLFSNHRCEPYITEKILGINDETRLINTSVPKEVNCPRLPDLNYFQSAAVKRALQSRVMLIQGPPGTGKTVTTATIVFNMIRLNKSSKILVCAPSNIAVDHLTEKISACGIDVVRLCARSRESVSSSVEHLTLHQQLKEISGAKFKRLHELLQKREQSGDLDKSEEDMLAKLILEGEAHIINKASVVCCTCAGAFDRRLRSVTFKRVLIDEATQATEPECLLPIMKGAQQLILVGDHKQLGPVVMCKKAAVAGYDRSLFERLVSLGNRPYRLHVQYRMHPVISEFPSNTFYEGSLQNGVSIAERVYEGLDFPWPVPDKPIFFYNSIGLEEISASGTSYLNRSEAYNVEKIVTSFLRSGLESRQLGIITPYEGQRAFITNFLQQGSSLSPIAYADIEISSVDSFQGREKDFIILSCVRSNENLGVGFLSDPRRLNVALTRAKYGLVICGNAKVLSKQPLWSNLLNFYKELGVLVEGPLSYLKPCMVSLQPPQKLELQPAKPFPDAQPLSFLSLGSFAAPENPDILADL